MSSLGLFFATFLSFFAFFLCSPSVFVLAVLAYSAGSTPAMPIILTEEREKENNSGEEGVLEDLCTHKYLHS